MEDELFSGLTWDEKLHTRSGKWTLANGEIAVFHFDGKDEPISEAERNTVKFVMANEPRIRHKIAASMTELYQEWNDGETMTPEGLAQMIYLTDLSVWEDGSGELYYETVGELFTDHTICAFIDASGEVGEPELEG